jgi:putative membrane-bound dehydrogenase-like protein
MKNEKCKMGAVAIAIRARVGIAFFILHSSICIMHSSAADVVMPKVADERLSFELFAAEPQIVTPTGIAVDEKGRVLCVESHTHFRPNGYDGPVADRIQRYEDTDGDGKADRVTTFHEGETHTMNLAIHHDGSVIVATRREVFRLRDKDDDGKADERTTLVKLETKGDYPHNGLSGVAFDYAGNIFFGFGENLGEPYTIIGSDGGKLTGGGEGGNVYRCGPNGEKVHQIATGFWNPFHLANDSYGRLFAVDNDPDARPPCRLLHVVEGGDYGFRFRLGRRGTHPFQSWNGEVPGTLPMVAGTGEAPSGVIAYESDGLPEEYFGNLLVTSWGEHRIERHVLVPRGASYGSKMTSIVQGGEDFRPVGIALAPDGSLYVSDWVKKDYNLHKHGRIWRLRWNDAPKAERPTGIVEGAVSRHRPLREAAMRRMMALNNAEAKPSDGKAGVSEQSAAVNGLMAKRPFAPTVWATFYSATTSTERRNNQMCAALAASETHPSYSIPLGALAASQMPLSSFDNYQSGLLDPKRPALILAALHGRIAESSTEAWKNGKRPKVDLAVFDGDDPFLELASRRAWETNWTSDDATRAEKLPTAKQRLAALLVMKHSKRTEYREHLPKWLADADARVRFAAVQWVAEEKLTDYREAMGKVLAIEPVPRELFEGYLAGMDILDGTPRADHWAEHAERHVASLVDNTSTPIHLRRLAMRMLRPDYPKLSRERWEELLANDDAELKLEAVRSLRGSRLGDRAARLMKLAEDTSQSDELRGEAIIGLDAADEKQRVVLVSLATGGEGAVQSDARRALAGAALSDTEREKLAATRFEGEADALFRILTPTKRAPSPAAADLSTWLGLLDNTRAVGDGDPVVGRRVFFSRVAGCANCHQVDGRGGRIGPDLTLVAGQLSRERLIDSILNPSKEVAPHYVPYAIRTESGETFTGVFVGEDGARNQQFGDVDGKIHRVSAEQIEERKALDKSIMPENIGQTLTMRELFDLVAFLRSKEQGARSKE